MLRIVHINSEYSTNPLYINLLNKLSFNDIKQINYAPIKTELQYEANSFVNSNISFLYSEKLRKCHRFFYFQKLNFLQADIKKQIDLKSVDVVHAHKMFSDGGIALKLYREYGIPYIITIRATDLFVFYKYMKFTKQYARDILLNSEKIIILNSKYVNYLKYYHSKSFIKFENKIELIPNGIDDFWFNHSQNIKKENRKNLPFNLVYTGTFIKRKRVGDLLKSVVELREEGYNITLTLVGKGGYYQNKVEQYSSNFSFIGYMGQLDFSQLILLYENMHAFVLPSYRETFGLVYIEALSQGLPIIYSKGEAIDGYFKEGYVGYSITPGNLISIKNAIRTLMKNYSHIQLNCLTASKRFNWHDISKNYLNIYKDISNVKNYLHPPIL